MRPQIKPPSFTAAVKPKPQPRMLTGERRRRLKNFPNCPDQHLVSFWEFEIDRSLLGSLGGPDQEILQTIVGRITSVLDMTEDPNNPLQSGLLLSNSTLKYNSNSIEFCLNMRDADGSLHPVCLITVLLALVVQES